MLVQKGVYLKQALQSEWVRSDTLESDIRLTGEDRIEEVKEAWLEGSGKLSVFKNTHSRRAQKQDRKVLFR